MDIEVAFLNAGKKHQKSLEQFTEEVFRGIFLPSHGPAHHRRVWLYAVELASDSNLSVVKDVEQFACKLIIACYLHDTGMAYDRGERHGKKSAELCVRFLERYSLPEEEYADVLEAIERHDDKEASSDRGNNLLSLILNTADDLDAFGFTGIYRYIEIYLERDIPLKTLGERILSNASGRFENFRRFYGSRESLFKRHQRRFGIVEDFCNNYIKESEVYRFGTGRPYGYCGIAEVIGTMLQNRLTPMDGLDQSFITKNIDDSVIRWYFSELGREYCNIP
ncbi:MAG TPA: HD domain-containing protein [Bacteroidales bacterium]|nr:HD domain-containing protein [Bacteroidales bacterium]HOK76039.1 HD domain-containing protein [Bacteroidales bacterium]